MMQRTDRAIGLFLSVTGHRDLSGADPQALRAQLRTLFLQLQEQFRDLPLTLLTSLASGGDTLAAEVAVELGVALLVPLPMPRELYEADFTGEALAEFRRLCAVAEVFELPLAPGNDPQAIAEPGAARDRQYAQLGVFLSCHCQVLIALWDGVDSRELGGTASVVGFHLRGVMPGWRLPGSEQHRLLAEQESDLVYHIPCPRAGTPPCSGGWRNRNGAVSRAELEANYFSAFQRMREFRHDRQRFAAAIEQGGDTLLQAGQVRGDGGLSVLDTLYRASDWLAIHYHRRVTSQLLFTHLMAALMGISFIIYSEFDGFGFLLPVFLALFAAGGLVTWLANRRHWHRKYLDNRALAEGLRVQFYWTLAGIEDVRGTAVAYDNLMQKQDVELAWIRHIMRNAGALARPGFLAPDEGMSAAIQGWLGDESSRSGQLGYFRSASMRLQAKLRRTESLGRMCLWAGIAIAVFMLLFDRQLDDTAMARLLVLMGVLPLVAGIREAYAYKKADKELTKQYRFMHGLFSRARACVGPDADLAERQRVLRELGEACLEEHSEWILVHRERPLEGSGLQT